MTKRRPFLFFNDGSQFGISISRTDLRRMRKAEKLEAMIGWFHQNFEDPAQSTPYESAEGGYQWIWGGPYEARDELYSKFGDIVSESLIEEAVKEIESDGIVDWAPVHTADDYDEDEPEPEAEGRPIDEWLKGIPDDSAPELGSAEDHDLRARAIDALKEVEQIAPPPAVASIGHNQPPEGIDDEAGDIRIVARGLRTELEVEKPRIPVVKRLTGQLGKITGGSVRWTGHKLDVMFEEAAKSIGKTAGKALFATAIVLEPHVQQAVAKSLEFVMDWLGHVTFPGF